MSILFQLISAIIVTALQNIMRNWDCNDLNTPLSLGMNGSWVVWGCVALNKKRIRTYRRTAWFPSCSWSWSSASWACPWPTPGPAPSSSGCSSGRRSLGSPDRGDGSGGERPENLPELWLAAVLHSTRAVLNDPLQWCIPKISNTSVDSVNQSFLHYLLGHIAPL